MKLGKRDWKMKNHHKKVLMLKNMGHLLVKFEIPASSAFCHLIGKTFEEL